MSHKVRLKSQYSHKKKIVAGIVIRDDCDSIVLLGVKFERWAKHLGDVPIAGKEVLALVVSTKTTNMKDIVNLQMEGYSKSYFTVSKTKVRLSAIWFINNQEQKRLIGMLRVTFPCNFQSEINHIRWKWLLILWTITKRKKDIYLIQSHKCSLFCITLKA